jgi:hypothetical protein
MVVIVASPGALLLPGSKYDLRAQEESICIKLTRIIRIELSQRRSDSPPFINWALWLRARSRGRSNWNACLSSYISSTGVPATCGHRRKACKHHVIFWTHKARFHDTLESLFTYGRPIISRLPLRFKHQTVTSYDTSWVSCFELLAFDSGLNWAFEWLW